MAVAFDDNLAESINNAISYHGNCVFSLINAEIDLQLLVAKKPVTLRINK